MPDTRRPSQRWKAAPPGDALQPPPQRTTPARKGARRGAGTGSTRPHRPHPGHTGRGTLAARSGGRADREGTAPDTRRPSQRWKAPPRGRHSATPTASSVGPQGRTLWDRCWVHTPASTAPGTLGSRNPGCTLRRTSAARGGTAPDTRRPSQRWKAPPRGRPSATPTASNAGPQGRTLWGRCWVHMPASTAPGTHGSRNPGCTLRRTSGAGKGQRLTPGAPHNGGRHPPGDALPPPPQRATPARKGTRCGTGAGSTPASTAPGTHESRNPGCTLRRTSGRGRDSA